MALTCHHIRENRLDALLGIDNHITDYRWPLSLSMFIHVGAFDIVAQIAVAVILKAQEKHRIILVSAFSLVAMS